MPAQLLKSKHRDLLESLVQLYKQFKLSISDNAGSDTGINPPIDDLGVSFHTQNSPPSSLYRFLALEMANKTLESLHTTKAKAPSFLNRSCKQNDDSENNRIWVRFNSGHSTAVRKLVRVSDFIQF